MLLTFRDIYNVDHSMAVKIKPDFKPLTTYALRWFQLSTCSWAATDRTYLSDKYEAEVNLYGKELDIDTFIAFAELNRRSGTIVVNLSQFNSQEHIFGADVDYSGTIYATAVIDSKKQNTWKGFMLTVKFILMPPITFTGGQGSLPLFRHIDIGYEADAEYRINKLDTYNGQFFFADHDSDNGIFNGTFIFTNEEMIQLRRFIATKRGDSFLCPNFIGVDNPFGRLTYRVNMVNIIEFEDLGMVSLALGVPRWEARVKFAMANTQVSTPAIALLVDPSLTSWSALTDGSDIQVECIGGGGGGPSGIPANPGGGGGEYRCSTIPYVSGSSVPIHIGAGGAGALVSGGGSNGEATTWNTSTVVANPGLVNGNGGSGGTGTLHNNGGSGGSTQPSGGGGAGGELSAGGNGHSLSIDGDAAGGAGGGVYSGKGGDGVDGRFLTLAYTANVDTYAVCWHNGFLIKADIYGNLLKAGSVAAGIYTEIASVASGHTDCFSLHSDGSYIYAGHTGAISVWSFNGVTLQYETDYALAAGHEVRAIEQGPAIGAGHDIYFTSFNSGISNSGTLYRVSFNGTAITFVYKFDGMYGRPYSLAIDNTRAIAYVGSVFEGLRAFSIGISKFWDYGTCTDRMDVEGMAIDAAGNVMVADLNSGLYIYWYDWTHFSFILKASIVTAEYHEARDVQFDSTSNLVYLGTSDGHINVASWDGATLAHIASLSYAVYSMSLLPGLYVAAASITSFQIYKIASSVPLDAGIYGGGGGGCVNGAGGSGAQGFIRITYHT